MIARLKTFNRRALNAAMEWDLLEDQPKALKAMAGVLRDDASRAELTALTLSTFDPTDYRLKWIALGIDVWISGKPHVIQYLADKGLADSLVAEPGDDSQTADEPTLVVAPDGE